MKSTMQNRAFNLNVRSVKGLVTVLVSILIFAAATQAQTFPSSNNCASKDLDLIEAALRSSTGENTLTSGNRKVYMNVTNRTGNDKRSFSMWGNLKRYDINGSLKSTTKIFLCVDSVKKYSTVTLPAKDSLYYAEGEELLISDIYTAWSSSKGTENCDWLYANTAKISPNCATKTILNVYSGVNTRLSANKATCANYGKGQLKAKPFGGRNPYYVSVGQVGSTAVETRLVKDSTIYDLLPGSYKIVVMDAKNNMSVFYRTIDNVEATAKPSSNITHPNCGNAYGKMKVTNYQNGFTYELKQGGVTIYSTNQDSLDNIAAGDYEFTVSRGTCSNKDSVKINKQPRVPNKPDFTVTDPTCTKSKGHIKLNSVEEGVSYTLEQNDQVLLTAASTDAFGDFDAGDYMVVARTEFCSNGGKAHINPQPSTPSKPDVIESTRPSLCATGSATVTAPLGGSLRYSSDGGATWQRSNVFDGLGAASASGLQFVVTNQWDCISEVGTVVCSSSIAPADTTLSTTTTGAAAPKYLGAASLSESAVTVKTVPNPFGSKVRFVINAPQAGNGTLEIFNTMGQKVKTVYQGYINAGTNFFDLTLPSRRSAELVYVLRMGEASVTGRMIQANEAK